MFGYSLRLDITERLGNVITAKINYQFPMNFYENLLEKIVVQKIERCHWKAENKGFLLMAKKFNFRRDLHVLCTRENKCAIPYLTKKSAKPDCPCLAYNREEMRQIRDFMKDNAKNFVGWI